VKLREYIDPLAYDAAFWMAGINNPAYPLDQLGTLSLEVSEKLRTMAIIVLLTKGDSDTFYHDLIRSGVCREVYLRRCQAEGLLEDHHRASGRYEPLLDALAAGDFALAQKIAALSPTDWMSGHEYEDDYCWAQILHAFVLGRPQAGGLPDLIARLDVVLDGAPSSKLVVARALEQGNEEDFDAAFDTLLRERERRIEADIARGQFEKPKVVAERQVFIEGLALLRLAETKGLHLQPEYLFCPALARRPMITPFPGE
jgi:hypothetical protein